MNDLISRQGMCDSLNKYRIEKTLEGKDVSLVWECIDKVLQEPPAQQWIPCSKRLPEDDEEVLITTSWDAVHIAWHDEDGWNEDMCSLDDDEVKAWMPLPEPWKGDADAVD